jgi:hypothetical protein
MGGSAAECADDHAPQNGEHHDHDDGCAKRKNDCHW